MKKYPTMKRIKKMNDIIHWKLYAEWLDKGNFCADFFASYDELWNRLFNPELVLITIVERK